MRPKRLSKFIKVSVALLTLLTLSSCAIHYTAPSKDPAASATAQTPRGRAIYKIEMPSDNDLLSPLLLESLNALNAGVGYDVLILPPPLGTPSSDFKWTSKADGLAAGACSGSMLSPPTSLIPALELTMNSAFADKFFDKIKTIGTTDFYRAFLYCIGKGLGFADATAANDVMTPNFSVDKDLPTFYAKIRAVTAASAATGS